MRLAQGEDTEGTRHGNRVARRQPCEVFAGLAARDLAGVWARLFAAKRGRRKGVAAPHVGTRLSPWHVQSHELPGLEPQPGWRLNGEAQIAHTGRDAIFAYQDGFNGAGHPVILVW